MSGLRLLAEDEEDLKIISAHLQDAVMRVGDVVYLPRQHRFVAMVNRFCWEGCPEGSLGERVLTGLHFDGVLKVQSQHVRQDDLEAVAELLAINFTPESAGAGVIDLMLAGGGRIRLYVECIDAVLRDMTEPRPAVARPEHDLERS
ncbi:MAG TPA: DUF2948 family protein [Micropepsaceae bacterium]|nr:DUF2948 family protein [Micropepsaceae bacterium]